MSCDKQALKERGLSLFYWSVNLIVACGCYFQSGGLCDFFLRQITTHHAFHEWFFWGVLAFLCIAFMVWCVAILIEDVRIIMGCKKEENEDAEEFRKLPILESLPKEESHFLQRIIQQKDQMWKIAVAIVLKDFVKEQNHSICDDDLKDFIPTHSRIMKDTETSLRSLVSAMSLIKKYETDKYYNTNLIMSIGMKLV